MYITGLCLPQIKFQVFLAAVLDFVQYLRLHLQLVNLKNYKNNYYFNKCKNISYSY